MLDTENLKCISSCPTGTFPIELEHNWLCRSYDIYVDSSSTLDYELGTRAYPFKSFYPVTKELFNFHICPDSQPQPSYKLFFRSGTTHLMYLSFEPFLLLNLENVTVLPYGPNEGDEFGPVFFDEMAYSLPDNPVSKFNALINVTSYDYQLRIGLGHIESWQVDYI